MPPVREVRKEIWKEKQNFCYFFIMLLSCFEKAAGTLSKIPIWEGGIVNIEIIIEAVPQAGETPLEGSYWLEICFCRTSKHLSIITSRYNE
jgi:hypothetical protein